MQSKLPLLPSGPGGVRKSTFHGPWRQPIKRRSREAASLLVLLSLEFVRAAEKAFLAGVLQDEFLKVFCGSDNDVTVRTHLAMFHRLWIFLQRFVQQRTKQTKWN